MSFLPLITEYLHTHSGLEAHRNYLGMSQIADCPTQLYLRYLQGMKLDDGGHRNAYRGYMIEGEMKKILTRIGVMKERSERSLVAHWDARYQGHTDGETLEGRLLEIKSLAKHKYEQVRESKKLLTKHYFQIQTYMKHGQYMGCDAVLICPETFEIMVLPVQPNYKVQNDLDSKARDVLMHIDAGKLPACQCGRCEASVSRAGRAFLLQ